MKIGEDLEKLNGFNGINMWSVKELELYLQQNQADFEILCHEKLIRTAANAVVLFDLTKVVPVFVMKTKNGLVAFIVSGQRGGLHFKQLKVFLHLHRFEMAKPEEILNTMGYELGNIPLIGHGLPVF